MKALFFIIAVLSFQPAMAKASGTAHPWMAYGDLRGQIAPCGCDPTTDLGGLARLGRAVAETREKHPNVWLFSLGNNLPQEADAAKQNALLSAEAALNPLATLLRSTEWKALDAIAAMREKRKDQRPYYVLSNLKRKSPQVDYARLAPGLVVMGYAVIPEETRVFDGKLKTEWRTFVKRHDRATKVLLFAGSNAELAAIEKAAIFDVIVSGNAAPEGELPSPIEKSEPGRLLRGKNIYAVPSFGQGLLRGGGLRGMRPLSDLLNSCPPGPGPACLEKNHLMAGGQDLVTWLDRSWDGANGLEGILKEYHAATAQAFDVRAGERKKDLASTPYAGSAACEGCHAKEYAVWKTSRHADAFATLVKKGQQKDAECVGCHVLGWEAKGGFVSPEESPQFQNVQCENCHGPRLEHTKNPALKGSEDPRAACVTCHQGPHSPGFDQAKYWEKIRHP